MSKPKLHIAIIGEGKNDVGIMGNSEWQEGTIQEYLRCFLANDFDLEFTPLAVSKTETKNIRGLKGGRYRKYKIKGIAKKLFRFVSLYKNRSDFNLLIFFSDTDKTQGERASKTEAKRKYQAILNDINEAKRLLDDEMPNLTLIPMIPIRILECWLLGDYEGFENIGCSPQNPLLPSKPELVWGDQNDPNSNYPKNYLKRILENGGFENNTETYQLIILNNNLDNLKQNCSLSFAPFAAKMENYLHQLLKK